MTDGYASCDGLAIDLDGAILRLTLDRPEKRNAIDDGMVGQQVFAGEATRLAYGTDEAVEGRDAFLEKRDPDWSPYPYHF